MTCMTESLNGGVVACVHVPYESLVICAQQGL